MMRTKWEIVFGGVGGQGLLLNGELLGAAASILEKRQAVMIGAYGTEARGAFTKADLILSEEYIDFPEVLRADVVVALAQVAYDRYAAEMPEGSILLYNSDRVKETPSPARRYGVPTETIASGVGNPSGQNMVALGALLALTRCARPDSVKEMIRRRFKGTETLIAGNIAAFEGGYASVLG
ncbi:MAG: 2-oxoacid:acceptor oxidoreductase family protein [Clostridiales Family XIII bacterium]|jgi:2-oxoglutarate ferredoxin oxidoreductase subunit gamma|nr:2-oxoacid:acceptor oxidoreductase family protein [Clostridiales Family XIII bacterium]